MDQKEIEILLQKYNSGDCTDDERKIVEELYQIYLDKTAIETVELEGIKETIFSKLPQKPIRNKILNLSFLWKASAIFIVLSGAVYWQLKMNNSSKQSLAQRIHPIEQQENIAQLVLSNGDSIDLNTLKIGDTVLSAEIKIIKTKNGLIQYEALNSNPYLPAKWNTASTSKGVQYCLNLADGSKVWLNASSKLKFPSAFSDQKRVVELIGEGYFEVVHDSNKPFYVKSKGQVIQVLGTHFNISAYPEDMGTYTTLSQGKVMVKTDQTDHSVILKPGDQSILDKGALSVIQVDPTHYMGWKDGSIRFNEENIREVMNKLQRWYNIDEVIYQGKISEELFTGKFNRKKDIYQILETLEKTEGLHFKVEGRRIIVMP